MSFTFTRNKTGKHTDEENGQIEELDRELSEQPDENTQDMVAEAQTEKGSEYDWRGVGGENRDDIPVKATIMLRDRSRKLLGDLLRPYRRLIALLVVVVVLENGARLAIPYLVKVGIDSGIPPLIADNKVSKLIDVVVALAVCAIVQALARVTFLQMWGRIGQTILLVLRQRVFAHFQKLSLSFHEKYTSGRVISRQTSDVDAI